MKKITLLLAAAGLVAAFSMLNCSNTSVGKNDEKGITENIQTQPDNPSAVNEAASDSPAVVSDKIIYLNTDEFKEQVFDYSTNSKWKYTGKVPAIVDFYADWCRPCKMLEPTLIELQKEYKGKIQIYKVNTDKNPELSRVFGINGIPALLFIPMEGEPQMATGLLPKETLETTIADVMKVAK
jgi:thioredoxin